MASAEYAKHMIGGYVALGSEAVNANSFELVFSTYYSYVSKLARGLLGNMQDAEDATQEVFLRVYKALSTYDPERGGMNTWLAKLTVNVCRTHRRRNFFHNLWRPSQVDEDAEQALELVDPSLFGALEEHVVRKELHKTVRDVLDNLRPEHRTVLVLHYYMDTPCGDIARILECPEGTVYSRLHYARRVVQSQLEKHLKHAGSEVGL